MCLAYTVETCGWLSMIFAVNKSAVISPVWYLEELIALAAVTDSSRLGWAQVIAMPMQRRQSARNPWLLGLWPLGKALGC